MNTLASWAGVGVMVATKSGVLLLAALAVLRLLRGRSAAVRHLVLAVALGGALVLPALAGVLPLWSVPILPAAASAAVEDALAVPLVPPALLAPTADAAASRPAAEPGSALPAARVEPDAPIPSVTAWIGRLLAGSGLGVVALVWLAGTGLLLLRLGVGVLRLHRLARRAEPVRDPEWLALADRLGAQLGLRHPVALRRCAGDVVPMVWGVRRPTILLPAAAAGWSEQRRAVVLLHEMSHVVRRDLYAHLVAELCRAAYWFNPLVWSAARRLREERERACDDHVISAGTSPTDYANHLLAIVRGFGTSAAASPALAMARRSQFEGRMLAILDPFPRRRQVSARATLLAGAAALGVVVPLAALAPASRDAQITPAPIPFRLVPRVALPALPADSVPLQIRAIAEQYGVGRDVAAAIVDAAQRERLDLGLAVLLVRTESGFREDRVSPSGAIGLTQITPAAAATLQPGVSATQLRQRDTNLRLGFRYLKRLLDRYQGDTAAALLAYHSGSRATDRLRAGGVGTRNRAAATPAAPAEPFAPTPATPTGRMVAPRGSGSELEAGRMVELLGSSGDQASFLIRALRARGGPIPPVDAIRASTRVRSSGDRASVLRAALDRRDLGVDELNAVLGATRTIGSDGDEAATLLALVRGYRLTPGLLPAFVRAARDIRSDGDLATVLQAAIETNPPSDWLVAGVLDAAAGLESDGDLAPLLVGLARRGPLSDASRARYIQLAEQSLGGSDRRHALDAVAAPTGPAPPAKTSTGSRRSGWTTEWHSDNDTDGVRTRMSVRARDVFLSRDGGSVDSIDPGGRLEVEELAAGVTRGITVVRADSGFEHRFTVNGVERPFDAAARDWFRDRLRQLHRQMKGQTRL